MLKYLKGSNKNSITHSPIRAALHVLQNPHVIFVSFVLPAPKEEAQWGLSFSCHREVTGQGFVQHHLQVSGGSH
jgi:hypothetical protein